MAYVDLQGSMSERHRTFNFPVSAITRRPRWFYKLLSRWLHGHDVCAFGGHLWIRLYGNLWIDAK